MEYFDTLLEIGKSFLDHGYCTDAELCFVQARELCRIDVRPLINLANIYCQTGNHERSRSLYQAMIDAGATHPAIRRGLIVTSEYDPQVSIEARGRSIKDWANFIQLRNSEQSEHRGFNGELRRVGYLSADFCQHTVGLLVRGVIANHDPMKFEIFCYHNGQIRDWVTFEIQSKVTLRHVVTLSDEQLARQIRDDKIDLLVDLSGHTAGSRIEVMVKRPAPVQISWLGVYATTGLHCLDGSIFDEPHCTAEIEREFCEPIIKLSSGRIPFLPVPWTPEPKPPPFDKNGYITYGSFNNTAKYNPRVLKLWSELLLRNTDSKLILKWKTFQDPAFQASVKSFFIRQGVLPFQIELRGQSSHAETLKQYSDIDIALDPFPFSGGLTSYEAIYQGVPVITLPMRDRAVSRQTYAIYKLMNYCRYVADGEEHYLKIGEDLANDQQLLIQERENLPILLRNSPCSDIRNYTAGLENEYSRVYERVRSAPSVRQRAVR